METSTREVFNKPSFKQTMIQDPTVSPNTLDIAVNVVDQRNDLIKLKLMKTFK